jgi:hypothetical protein
MKAYEYLLMRTPDGKDIDDRLRVWGLDGWLLCAIDYGCLIFAREINTGEEKKS